MTREFAKLVLSSLATWEGQERMITAEQVEAIKVLSQETSLPSNLNEAAMQFAQRAYSPFDDPYEVSKAFENDVNCFKAGAKWMAKQGYTQEGIARPDDDEIWVNIKDTDIKDGDEVIVQIRKK